MKPSPLDVSIRAQRLNLVRDVQEATGVSYVFVSHDLGVVRHVADEVAVMYLGRFLEQGPTDEITGAPAHPYTQSPLSAAPPVDDWQGDRAKEIILSGRSHPYLTRRAAAGSGPDTLRHRRFVRVPSHCLWTTESGTASPVISPT